MSGFTESVVEDAALAWLEALGYVVLHGELANGRLVCRVVRSGHRCGRARSREQRPKRS